MDVKVADLESWLSPAGAARNLDISTERVRQLVGEGRLKAVNTPNGRLIEPTSVEQLRQERAERREHLATA